MAKEKVNGRQHKATFAKDSRNPGSYNIRIEGPRAGEFASREVPVTMRDGTEKTVKLLDCFWCKPHAERTDEDGNVIEPARPGIMVGLYHFKPEQKEAPPEADF
jgi:hypothetical protein